MDKKSKARVDLIYTMYVPMMANGIIITTEIKVRQMKYTAPPEFVPPFEGWSGAYNYLIFEAIQN